ncbi:MAG: hypothetical protein ACYDA1_05525 [Vulcanimicrobiaceae bacterium]
MTILDANACELIADALTIISPDDEAQAERARNLEIVFRSLNSPAMLMPTEDSLRVYLRVEGGIIQHARSNAPCKVFVADNDIFEDCAGDESGTCDSEESESDRRDHAFHREKSRQFEDAPSDQCELI